MAEQFTQEAMFAESDEAFLGPGDGLVDPSEIGALLLRTITLAPRVAFATAQAAGAITRAAVGRADVETPKDWRFRDPAWADSFAYRALGRAYTAWADSMREAMGTSDGDWRTTERANFLTELVTSALSPTNFLPTNPAAVKRAFETSGASLMRGAHNMLRDARTNGFMPSQVQKGVLKVGTDLAATPGAVVFRDERCEVIRYTPTTPRVRRRPIVVITPQINKFYFLDLRPSRSFVEFAVSRGLQVFIVSWRNPTAEHAHWGLADYVDTLDSALDAARSLTASETVDVFGFCAGGITTAALLATLASRNDHRVAAASFAVTMIDFDAPALIGMLASPRLVQLSKWNSRRKGVLNGVALARVFAWFRPNDLVWNYWVANYLLGEDPPVFDILAWNADSTNMPAALHCDFLDIFAGNLLTKPGGLTLLGAPVDLAKIDVETYVTGATSDHLTPWVGCYRTTQLMSGPSTFVLSNAGHIQSLVNPPGNPKAYYLTGPQPGPDPQEWLDAAEQRPGTWWEHWADWELARQPATAPAPKRLGNRRYPILAEAPGHYVHDRL